MTSTANIEGVSKAEQGSRALNSLQGTRFEEEKVFRDILPD